MLLFNYSCILNKSYVLKINELKYSIFYLIEHNYLNSTNLNKMLNL